MDYAAPYSFDPTTAQHGVGSHPHRGFETVTLAYSGEVTHKDSSGGGGTIQTGDVQWMTAGSGVVHEEFHSTHFAQQGGLFEMVQLWVNLPAKDKMNPARYQSLAKASITVVDLADNAGYVRIIAGHYLTAHGPAETHTPMQVFDVFVSANQSITLPAQEGGYHAGVFTFGQAEIY